MLHSLDSILSMVRDGTPAVEIYQAIVKAGVALTGATPDLAFLRIADCSTGQTRYLCTLDSEYAHNVLKDLQGVTGRAMRTGQTRLVPDVRRDPDYVELASKARSELAVPIKLGDACYGVLNFESTKPHWFTQEHAQRAEMLAHLAALTEQIDLERTRVSEDALLRGEPEVNSRLLQRLDQLLDHVLDLFAPASGLMAEVMVATSDTKQLITLRLRPDSSVAQHIRLRAGEGVSGQVFTSGVPRAGDVHPEDPGARGTGSSADVTHLRSTRSSLVMPLWHNDVMLGVLNVESPVAGTFGDASIARVLASGILADILQELSKISRERLSDSTIVQELLDKFRYTIAFAIDPEDRAGAYYQILQVATQIIDEPNISGGLILLRDEAQHLVGTRAGDREYWAVRAARIGAFNSVPEWKLEDKSIARRVIATKTAALVPDVSKDPDYRDSGTGFTQSSELIVPLLDNGVAIGVIGLVSPALNTFTEDDQRNLEAVASIAVFAIKRSELIASDRRAREQLQCSQAVLDEIALLFPKDVRQLRSIDIGAVQQRVLNQILNWARQHTKADHCALVLAEKTEGRPAQLVIRAQLGTPLPNVSPRWSSQEGITGQAYRDDVVVDIPEIQQLRAAHAYVDYFAGAESEIAVPMRRGAEVVGVLDIESNQPHHFTTAHNQWVEFLGRQAAFALTAVDLATKTRLEVELASLSEQVDRCVAEMRDMLLAEIRPARDKMLRQILQVLCQTTNSAVGRIQLALNAYDQAGNFDPDHGQLLYMVSTDPQEVVRTASRFNSISVGAAGKAFGERKHLVFNDAASWASERLPRDEARNIKSGLFIPFQEGAITVGVLDVESAYDDTFTADAVAAGQKASDLVSKLIASARLRLTKLQADRLREFETAILRTQRPDLEGFMREVLWNAAALAEISQGWGRVTLIRPSRSRDLIFASQTFDITYRPGDDSFTAGADDDRSLIEFGIFQDAIRTQQPILILDTQRSRRIAATSDSPWPDARSMICVPLLRPAESGAADEIDTAGFLVLAAPNPVEFSESDKSVLTLFAQTVVSGMRNIALLGARKDLMQEVMHDFSKTLPSLIRSMSEVDRPLREAITAPDLTDTRRKVEVVGSKMVELKSLVQLTTNLMNWFFDLSNEELSPGPDAVDPLDVGAIIDDLEGLFTTLARVIKRYSVTWQRPETPLYVAGGDVRQRLISAVIFKYLENALKYTERDDITIRVSRHAAAGQPPYVAFAVSNSGKPIDELDRPLIFQLRFRPSSSAATTMGSGIGLFQAREIAERLDGYVDYQPDSAGHNVFYLYVPEVPNTHREGGN